jgi:hypothetical protein
LLSRSQGTQKLTVTEKRQEISQVKKKKIIQAQGLLITKKGRFISIQFYQNLYLIQVMLPFFSEVTIINVPVYESGWGLFSQIQTYV